MVIVSSHSNKKRNIISRNSIIRFIITTKSIIFIVSSKPLDENEKFKFGFYCIEIRRHRVCNMIHCARVTDRFVWIDFKVTIRRTKRFVINEAGKKREIEVKS